MILEGVIGIVEGLNPKLIRVKLEAFNPQPAERTKKDEVGSAEGRRRDAEASAPGG